MRSILIAVDRTTHGLLVRFPARPDVEADVRRFAVEEEACCRFWGFDVSSSDQELTLRWDGPPSAHEVLDRLGALLRGEAPITEIAGLL